MGEVYKELDEVKAELEKLKVDFRIKTELSESLRRAHVDQQTKCRKAILKVEKQEKELNVKSDEIVELRQLYEVVKSQLQETETSLKQVTSVNEKLRVDSGEKIQRLEGENRKLVSTLEEATARNDEMESKLHNCNEEIEGLKGRLSEIQRKCLEAEEKARVGKELMHREDVIMKLEEQSMSVQDKLKWKKEQFQHLEEAHRRLQDEFQLSKKEWEVEKSAMLAEMTMLQSKLDSYVRTTESLESQLKMCNQALVHEESRRKLLEVQLSESKQCFENVLAQYEEVKEKIESLSAKRDEDIAGLRNSLGLKEVLLKETEYRVTYLEQENKELLGTVKELQEAQINKRKVDPSVTKLRNKFKDLEKVHSKCVLTLEEKEVEWNSKMEKLIVDLKCCENDMKRQNEQLHQLKTQLDHCHSTIEVSGEETSILFMVLKSELSDVYSKLNNLEAHTEAFSDESADSSPLKAQSCLEQARAEIASLTQKLMSLKLLEKRGNVLEDALEEHKKMLEESSQSQLCLKEQVSQMEVELRKLSTSLEKSNNALTEKISEASQTGAELLLWKSKAESFRTCLEQSQEVCKKLESSILEQVEIEKGLRKQNEISEYDLKVQGQKIDDLQQKIDLLNQMVDQKEAMTKEAKLELAKAQRKEGNLFQLLKEKDTVVESLKNQQSKFEGEKEELFRIIKENNVEVQNLKNLLEVMKKESATSESRRVEAEIKFDHEKEEFSRVIAEKDEGLRCLQGFASSLERDFDKVFLYVSCKELENLVEMISLQEALERTNFNMNVEMEKKNNVIDLLKVEISNLNDKIKLQDDSLLHSNQVILELEALAKANKLEMEKLTQEFVEDKAKLKERVEELKALAKANKLEMEKLTQEFVEGKAKLKERVEELEHENKVAKDNINSLSSERESLLLYIEGVCEQFGDHCSQDVELDCMLAKMMQKSGEDSTLISDGTMSDKNSVSGQKYVRKEVEPCLDRSPLRERNQ
ncbi:uncharacterized protein At4g38062-like [Silene latifolia]|uniref:uncharacterized protein At4g38062-like n=1 Tax=Silene latifolia TaxID=37657 RepID=UPI003D787B57